MNRTHRHLMYGLIWLVGFIVLAVLLSASWDISNIGMNKVRSQVGSLVWVLGFAVIFFSWARVDAPAHGKSKRAAALFALFWPFLVFLGHIAYLLYTRGLRTGAVSSLKFICFLLASGIGLALLGRVASGVLR
jgi:hypothetical protein